MLANSKSLMETMGLSFDAAMAALKVPENEWQTYAEQLEGLS